jgi:hypothetical protein
LQSAIQQLKVKEPTNGARIWSVIDSQWFRYLVLAIVLLILPSIALLNGAIDDPDIWWHLRTGQWIVQNRTLPRADPFSSFANGRPWVVYSWLYETLIYCMYRIWGLTGLIIYAVVFRGLIGIALYRLVYNSKVPFWRSMLITAVSAYAVSETLGPRPHLFTVLFFIIELDILFTVRRTGETRWFLLLPPIYAIWANIHVQFIYGLFVLGVAAAEPYLYQIASRLKLRITKSGFLSESAFSQACGPALMLTLGGCVLVTFVNPYSFRLYETIIGYVRETGPWEYITELQALDFRAPEDWCFLAVLLITVFSIAWRHRTDLFSLVILLCGIWVSFRSSRDLWFLSLVAVAITSQIWSNASGRDQHPFRPSRMQWALLSVVVAVGMVVGFAAFRVNNDRLHDTLAPRFPVKAVEFISANHLKGTLYNDFNWGGFLIWMLPNNPVAMDGRANVHGDERIKRSLKTWAGDPDWVFDSELHGSELVVASVKFPLTTLLRTDPQFKVLYEDHEAVVFRNTRVTALASN